MDKKPTHRNTSCGNLRRPHRIKTLTVWCCLLLRVAAFLASAYTGRPCTSFVVERVPPQGAPYMGAQRYQALCRSTLWLKVSSRTDATGQCRMRSWRLQPYMPRQISIAYLVHAGSCARLQCNEDMPYQPNCRCRPTWIRNSPTNSTIFSSWNWDLTQCDT